MPIKIPEHLPAIQILNKENIFVMGEERAYHQDIRPLKIVILNLMPTKEATETQILRLLGNSPLQVEITLLNPETHWSKNTSQEHLDSFYKGFSEIKNQRFDGMIITGAPVEHLEFEEVTYWEELKKIFDWTLAHVTSTLHICWGAQAALHHYFGIKKYVLKSKMFGVFTHNINKEYENCTTLLRGFDDVFYAPHSRYTGICSEDISKVSDLQILSSSPEAGVYIVATKDGRQIFVTGHAEYDAGTLGTEYQRDLAKELPIEIPKNYYPDDDPAQTPLQRWRSHASLLFSNWLNYYVYQETPYILEND